jgi:hypothetical protein
MKRFKYLCAEWPVSISTLAERLRANPFSDEAGDGFTLERVRNSVIEGRHYEKVVVNESISDPFGKESTYELVTYRDTPFRFSRTYPQIELRNPPRSIRVFVNRIAELMQFNVAVESLAIDPLLWADRIKGAGQVSGYVQTIDISGVAVEPEVSARFGLVGERDVLSAASKLIAKRAHTVDRLCLRIVSPLGDHSVILSATGSFRADDNVPPDVLSLVRDSLPATTAPSI